MEYFSLQRFHFIERERVGFGQNTLGSMIGVHAIPILEINGMGTIVAYNVDAGMAHPLYLLALLVSHLRYQLERSLRRQLFHAVSHVE